jgi:uncharacterized protein (DUF2249 family)
MTLDSAEATRVIDLRGLPCELRRATIFETFDALATGQSFQFVNDHDPAGLKRHFAACGLADYGWTYVEQGPDAWRIQLTRA